jgi:hypothetical protein
MRCTAFQRLDVIFGAYDEPSALGRLTATDCDGLDRASRTFLSALDHKGTSKNVRSMSALPLKAGIGRMIWIALKQEFRAN